ncbi:hypothetical protein [Halostagnicola sp. A-GB9-2]|nr:hypothetical protein [Halostagnicola sp. A-GB9-2]MDJ1433782.1 hypothetical protein [Halostagnicola sp. A-GB9-2]
MGIQHGDDQFVDHSELVGTESARRDGWRPDRMPLVTIGERVSPNRARR